MCSISWPESGSLEKTEDGLHESYVRFSKPFTSEGILITCDAQIQLSPNRRGLWRLEWVRSSSRPQPDEKRRQSNELGRDEEVTTTKTTTRRTKVKGSKGASSGDVGPGGRTAGLRWIFETTTTERKYKVPRKLERKKSEGRGSR